MNNRQSNIELFRIVATLFIVILHCNGWFLQLKGIDSWWYGGTNVAISRTLIQSITCIGVDCFVLISGFFGIRPSVKSLMRLFSCLVFFYVGGYLWECGMEGTVFTWKHFIKNCLAFSRGNWFIQCYLFLILLSPALNALMEKLSARQAAFYVTTFLLCALYFGCILNHDAFYFNRGYSVTTFMLIYLVGRYVKLHLLERVNKIKSIYLIALYGICVVALMVLHLFFPNTGLLWYCSPMLIVPSVLLLILFDRIKIQSKIVNVIGISVLAVYIFHTCTPAFNYMTEWDSEWFQNLSYVSYVARITFLIAGVFVFAVLLDKIRILLFAPLINYCGKIDELIKEKFNARKEE